MRASSQLKFLLEAVLKINAHCVAYKVVTMRVCSFCAGLQKRTNVPNKQDQNSLFQRSYGILEVVLLLLDFTRTVTLQHGFTRANERQQTNRAGVIM